MILYQFQCKECHQISEQYFNMKDCPSVVQCHSCQGFAHKIISIPGANLASESPDWIKSIREVVDKDGGRHCQEFLKNPTRDNYKTWMKESGLRHLEAGERMRPEPSPPAHIIADQIMKKRIKDRRIEI